MAAGWIEVAAIAVGGGGGAGLITSLARMLMSSSSNRAVATKTQVEASMLMVDQLQDEVHAAREEVRETRTEVAQYRIVVGKMNDDINTARGTLARMIGWIHEPDMSIERLRLRVPRIPAENGMDV